MDDDFIQGAFTMSAIAKTAAKWTTDTSSRRPSTQPTSNRSSKSTHDGNNKSRKTSILGGGSALEKAQMHLKGLRPGSASNAMSKSADMITERKSSSAKPFVPSSRRFAIDSDGDEKASSEGDDSEDELQAFLNKVDTKKSSSSNTKRPAAKSTDAVMTIEPPSPRPNSYLKKPSQSTQEPPSITSTSRTSDTKVPSPSIHVNSALTQKTRELLQKRHQTQKSESENESDVEDSSDSIGSDFESFMSKKVILQSQPEPPLSEPVSIKVLEQAELSRTDPTLSDVPDVQSKQVTNQLDDLPSMEPSSLESSFKTTTSLHSNVSQTTPILSSQLFLNSQEKTKSLIGFSNQETKETTHSLTNAVPLASSSHVSASQPLAQQTISPSPVPATMPSQNNNVTVKPPLTTTAKIDPPFTPSPAVPSHTAPVANEHASPSTPSPTARLENTGQLPYYPPYPMGYLPSPMHYAPPSIPIYSPAAYPSPGAPIPYFAWGAPMSPAHYPPPANPPTPAHHSTYKEACASCERRREKKNKEKKQRKKKEEEKKKKKKKRDKKDKRHESSDHRHVSSSKTRPIKKSDSVSSIEYIPDFTVDPPSDINYAAEPVDPVDADYTSFSSISSLVPHPASTLPNPMPPSFDLATQALPMYHPTLNLINDLLKTHIRLIEQFVHMSKSVGLSTANSSRSYNYTTLEDTKQFIERHRGPLLSMEEALKEIQESC